MPTFLTYNISITGEAGVALPGTTQEGQLCPQLGRRGWRQRHRRNRRGARPCPHRDGRSDIQDHLHHQGKVISQIT